MRLSTAAPGCCFSCSGSISAARVGPQSRAKGSQRLWLYQGNWVRSGRTIAAVASCRPRGQRPQGRRRSFQAAARASGQSGSHGQPPSSTSSSGTFQPRSLPSPASSSTRPAPSAPQISRAPSPRSSPWNTCQPMPGSRPNASPINSQHQAWRHKARSQASSTRPASSTGSSSGALSSNRALPASPDRSPGIRGWALSRQRLRSSCHHSRPEALTKAPSSIARRPWRISGSSVSAMAAEAMASRRLPGRSSAVISPASGTTALASRAGISLTDQGGGS